VRIELCPKFTKPEFANEQEAKRYAIEHETDPKKIAAQYHTEQPNEPDYIEKGIIDYLGNSKINQRDYERWGDRNNIGDHNKKWLDATNSDRTGLDQHAEILSHELGREVTPQDFIETIDRFKGRKNFSDSQKSETQKLLQDKYRELTGKNLTPSMAEKAHLSETKKLSDAEAKDFNKEAKQIGITEQEVDNYEQFRNDTEPGSGNGRNAEPTKDKVSKSTNEQSGSTKESSGDKGAQGEPEKQITPLEAAKAKRLEAKAKLQAVKNNLGIANDPEKTAKAYFDYHKALVNEAAEHIKAGVKTITDFAKAIGEKVDDTLKKAWVEANGGKQHTIEDFKELAGETRGTDKENDTEAIYGTKNSVTEALRDGMGLPLIEIPKDRSEDASLNAWKNGTRVPTEIIDQLLDPETDIYDKAITPNDEPIMREYIKQLAERGIELNKIKATLQESGDEGDLASVTQQLLNHYDQMERALNASKIGGNIWHKYGSERQLEIDEKGLILNSINRIRTIYGVEIPIEIKKELTDLQAKYDNLLAKNANIEEQLKAKLAEQQFEKAKPKKTIFGTKKRTETEFKEAIRDVLGDLKADWKKSFAKTYITLPGVPQFNAIAPHITRLMKLYADNGLSKIDDIIRQIHNDLKDDLEGITKDDIRDIIAGRYSDKKPLSDLQKQIGDLRTQARNKAKIEELENGIVAKTKSRGETSPAVKELQKQVQELKKKALNEYADFSTEELKKQIRSIQTQINKGDFFKMPVVKRLWEKDPNWIKNNKEKAELTFKLR